MREPIRRKHSSNGWSTITTRIAEQHLGQYSLSIIGGHQLQAGSSAQEFGDFLKTLEATGQGKKTLWAHLVRQVYDKFILTGNFVRSVLRFGSSDNSGTMAPRS